MENQMSARLFHAFSNGPGPFVHTINAIYQGLPGPSGIRQRIVSSQLESATDEEINSLKKFCIIIPIRNGRTDEIRHVLTQAAINAVSEKRCVLAFDFSNEAGNISLRDNLSRMLPELGVRNVEGCFLFCQNRRLPLREAGKVTIAYFDRFLLTGIHAANSLKTPETNLQLAYGYLRNMKSHPILCLNGTPRIHRIRTVLELVNQGLISLDGLENMPDSFIPYVSLGSLNYSKETMSPSKVRNAFRVAGRPQIAVNLDRLLQILPLRVDSFVEEGNALASKIDIEHYKQTMVSVVTETSTGNDCLRITEKTAKPLSLGHPFVVIGPMHCVKMARMMGFSVFDEFIDHTYDTIADPHDRLSCAISAAALFVKQINEGKINLDELVRHVRHNIHWATAGFYGYYWDEYIQFIVSQLRIEDNS